MVVLLIHPRLPFVNIEKLFLSVEFKMFKRYQVLLPEWLEDYIKFGINKYGLSFSELIRLQVCFSTLAFINKLHPEYRANITPDDILNTIAKTSGEEKIDRDEVKRYASDIYFETRKAIEYRNQCEKEKTKS